MADKLRDLSQPVDVPLLDATVAAFYGTGSKEEVTTFSVSPPASARN
jgi:exportin-1